MITCDHCGTAATCDTDLGKMCECCYDEFETSYDDEWFASRARLRYDVDSMPFEIFIGRVELDEDNDNIGGVGQLIDVR